MAVWVSTPVGAWMVLRCQNVLFFVWFLLLALGGLVVVDSLTESLILAQDERWRRA